jgi:hypothetical protein
LRGAWPGVQEFGIPESVDYVASIEQAKGKSRRVSLGKNQEPIGLSFLLRHSLLDEVQITGTGLNVKNLSYGLNFSRSLEIGSYRAACCRPTILSENLTEAVFVHLRAGDLIADNKLARYDMYPLSMSYLRNLRKELNRDLVFVGEARTNDRYMESVVQNFGHDSLLPDNCIHDDFRVLMNATKVAISLSTFSWLAAWLSTRAEEVYIPTAGFFHPKVRRDIDLVSGLDNRFKLIEYRPIRLTRKEMVTIDWLYL